MRARANSRPFAAASGNQSSQVSRLDSLIIYRLVLALLFAAGADSALWPLLIVFVVSSVLGLFYYLRVVGTVFASPLEAGTRGFLRRPPLLSLDTLVLITLAGVVIWLGVYPSPLIHLVQSI